MAQIGSTIDLETGDLTQFNGGTTIVGSSPVLESVAGSADTGNYGLHAYTASYATPYVYGVRTFTWPANDHLWVKARIRLNSKSGNAYVVFLRIFADSYYMMVGYTHGPSDMLAEVVGADSNLHQEHFSYPSSGYNTVKLHYDKTLTDDTLTVWVNGNQVSQVVATGHGHRADDADKISCGIYGSWGTVDDTDVSMDNIELWDSDPDEGGCTVETIVTTNTVLADVITVIGMQG